MPTAPSPSSPRSAAPPDLPSLTALRGFAALAVVLFHFADRAAPTLLLHNPLIAHGALGVDLFFVLSGFILAHVYGAEARAGGVRIGPFLRNRLARVYPLHLLLTVVALGWALTLTATGRLTFEAQALQLGLDPVTGQGFWATLSAHLWLVHAWGTTSGLALNTVSWSVSAEWFAYLLFPGLAALMWWRGRAVAPWLALAVALATLLAAELLARLALERPLTDLTYAFGIVRIVPEFMLGMAVSLAVAAGALRRTPLRLAIGSVQAGIVIVVATSLPTLLAPLLFAALIGLLAERDTRRAIAGVASRSGLLVELGVISYALYLVHPIAGKLVFQALAGASNFDPQAVPLWSVPVAMLACLAVAWIATHGVEHPARAALRGLAWRPDHDRPAPARTN